MDNNNKPSILFKLIYSGSEYMVQTYKGQYYSLMTLISERLLITGFGLCSGMGSCGTCMIEIYENYPGVKRSALACDVKIDDELANTVIIVENDRY